MQSGHWHYSGNKAATNNLRGKGFDGAETARFSYIYCFN